MAATKSIATKVYTELGVRALIEAPYDTRILFLQRFIRFVAYGSSTLVLTLFLKVLGYTPKETGLFMFLTLAGDVVISLVLTVIADKIGRRRILVLGSILMTASGVVFALSSAYWILVLAAVIGVISPSGNEIGPFKAIEETMLSQLASSTDRSTILAWYTLFGALGWGVGSNTLGWVIRVLQVQYGWSALDTYRVVFWTYASIGLFKLFLSLILTKRCEAEPPIPPPDEEADERRPLLETEQTEGNTACTPAPAPAATGIRRILPSLSSHTISLVLRLCLLFTFDSLGSGIAPNTWLVYYFNDKFGLDEGALGSLFAAASLLAAMSSLVAASLAKRIGLIKTMVFTHIPASVFLILLPFVPIQGLAMAILILRASITSMDQAPRQAFLAAAVLPGERTAVMGIINVVKTLSQSGGMPITGFLANANKLGLAFVLAGSLKVAYDVFMLAMFLGYRTIEEKAEERAGRTSGQASEQEPEQEPPGDSPDQPKPQDQS